jgi:ATP-dependent RNA helicase RhlE
MFSVLVFSRTKHGADKISRWLKRAGVVAVAIHSGRTQRQRQQALDGFRAGKYQVMVATDIAARGIDVEGISHVINYDVPTHAEDYVHRIGRTGRAAATGDAITFVSPQEQVYLKSVGKFIGRRLSTERCKGFSYVKSQPDKGNAVKSPGKDAGKSSGAPSQSKDNKSGRGGGKKQRAFGKRSNKKPRRSFPAGFRSGRRRKSSTKRP